MIYLQLGDQPDDQDLFVAMCETPVVAQILCETLNADEGYALDDLASQIYGHNDV